MIIAGPVFTEWYWGPLFFALFFGPFILPAAMILTWILTRRAKKRGRPLTGGRTALLALGLIVAISLLTVGGFWAKERIEENRLVASQAAKLTFQTYEPTWIFPGYDAERVRPIALPHVEQVSFTYRRGNDYVIAIQGPFRVAADVSAPGCDIRLFGLSSSGTTGRCTHVVTEGGREVYLTDLEDSAGKHAAITELDGTTAFVAYSELGDEAAIRYLDSLRAIDPEDLDYFGGY